jgi:hypothetical protein
MSGVRQRSIDEMGLEHAWSWFQLHASQRIQMVNFWLVSVAFISAAYVGAVADRLLGVATGVALGGAFVTTCFYRLERRTRQLIQIVEPVLSVFQSQLAEETRVSELNLLGAAERERTAFSSYGSVIRIMHWLVTAAFLAGAVGAFVALLLD